jgi:hypothetical protein
VLGPVIVEAKVAEDLLAGRALIEAIAPERAVLLGDKAEVMAQLVGGKQPWIRRAETSTARRKREWRAGDRTKRSIGRGERSGHDDIDHQRRTAGDQLTVMRPVGHDGPAGRSPKAQPLPRCCSGDDQGHGSGFRQLNRLLVARPKVELDAERLPDEGE